MTIDAESGPDDLRASVARLEHRLAEMEQRLGRLELPPPPTAAAKSNSAEPPSPTAAPRMNPPEPSAPAPTTLEKLITSSETRHRSAPSPPPLPQTAAAAPPVARPATSARRTPEALESKIGKSWASWIGGLLVLGSLLLFMKLAWDRGWLPGPAMRVALSLAAGVVLLGLGEWTFRKKMSALAASLSGTGLAVLMAALFAANVAFETPVLSQSTAFFAVIAVGAIGIILALRMKMMPLAILALLGMYVSPAILGSHVDHSLELLVYLGIVTAAGLTLSFFKRRWSAVRIFVFVAGWTWVLVWVALGQVPDHHVLAMAACGTFFFIYLAEMTAALTRAMKASGRAPATTASAAPAPISTAQPPTVFLETAAALLSIANSALAVIAFAIVFGRLNMEGLWIVPLLMAALMTAVRFLTPSKYFAISAGIQALGLITLAVPLYFNGPAITFAWAILGLVLGIYAYIVESRPGRIWTLVILGLVGIRICFFDFSHPDSQQILFAVGTESITRWMLMGWCSGIYGLVLGWLARPRVVAAAANANANANAGKAAGPRGDLWVTALCALGGSILWCAVSCVSIHPGGPLTLMALAWVLAVNGFSRLSLALKNAVAVEAVALFILVITVAKWLAYDGLQLSVIDPGMSPEVIPFLNLFVLNALLIIAAILTSRELRAGGNSLRAWFVAAICFFALTVETLRGTDYWLSGWLAHAGLTTDPWILKNVVLSVLWGLIGLIAVQVGFLRKIAPVRWAALALLGVTVAKVLLVDMANVGTFPRVLSFLTVGAALLLVSFVYHRMSRPRPPAA